MYDADYYPKLGKPALVLKKHSCFLEIPLSTDYLWTCPIKKRTKKIQDEYILYHILFSCHISPHCSIEEQEIKLNFFHAVEMLVNS